MKERHILDFLSRPENHALILQKNGKGFTPLHHALRTLRPRCVEALLNLGADILEPDPEGFTALHHVAGQCLLKYIDSPSETYLDDLIKQAESYLDSCKQLWQQCLDAGLPINGPDGTVHGNPPLFHYLAHHAGPERKDSTSHLKCHVDNFSSFFANADLTVRNKMGDTALHCVARKTKADGTKLCYAKCRPDRHDAEVFRFLVGEKGLDPLLEDAKGRSSLDVAAEGGRKEILEVFQQRN